MPAPSTMAGSSMWQANALTCLANRRKAISGTKCMPEHIPAGSATASFSRHMGPRQDPPPLPNLEPNLLADGQAEIWTALRKYNWVQAMEGDIDTAHPGTQVLG